MLLLVDGSHESGLLLACFAMDKHAEITLYIDTPAKSMVMAMKKVREKKSISM